MSGQSVLAGMFPPNDVASLGDNVLLQPIPVHVVPLDRDNVHGPEGNCHVQTELDEEVLNSDEALQFASRYNKTLDILRENTGDHIKDIYSAFYIYDALYCEMVNNLTLPDWFTEDMLWEYRQVIEPYHLSLLYKTVKQRRLRGGSLLTEYVKHTENYLHSVKNGSVSPKLVIFSAHDMTMINFLETLGTYNQKMVPYASAVFFELEWATSDASYHIRVWLRNDTSKEPYLISIPGCIDFCTFEQLKALVRPVLVDDVWAECDHHVYILGLDVTNAAAMALLLENFILLVLLCVFVVVVCCCDKKWLHKRLRGCGRLCTEENYQEDVPLIGSSERSDHE